MLLFAIAAVVMLAAGALIAYPLFFQASEPYQGAEAPGAGFSERDALLDALDDLEHAFFSGKLSRPDYETQRSALEAQYVRVAEVAARFPHGNSPPRPGRRG